MNLDALRAGQPAGQPDLPCTVKYFGETFSNMEQRLSKAFNAGRAT
jgi:hypothetical protein